MKLLAILALIGFICGLRAAATKEEMIGRAQQLEKTMETEIEKLRTTYPLVAKALGDQNRILKILLAELVAATLPQLHTLEVRLDVIEKVLRQELNNIQSLTNPPRPTTHTVRPTIPTVRPTVPTVRPTSAKVTNRSSTTMTPNLLSTVKISNPILNDLLKKIKSLDSKIDSYMSKLNENPSLNEFVIVYLKSLKKELGAYLYEIEKLGKVVSENLLKSLDSRLRVTEKAIEKEIAIIDKSNANTQVPSTTHELSLATSSLATNPNLLSTQASSKTTGTPQTLCHIIDENLSHAKSTMLKTKELIQKLEKEHKISETIALINEEKELETLIQDMTFLYSEIITMNTKLLNIESRLNDKLKQQIRFSNFIEKTTVTVLA